MKLTIREMTQVQGSLGRLGSLVSLPEKIMYKAYKLLKKFTEEMEPISKTNLQLHKKHGGKQCMGNIVVPPENMPAFDKEFKPFMEREVELDMDILSIELKHLKGLSATDLIVLEPLIEVIGVE